MNTNRKLNPLQTGNSLLAYQTYQPSALRCSSWPVLEFAGWGLTSFKHAAWDHCVILGQSTPATTEPFLRPRPLTRTLRHQTSGCTT